MTFRCLAFGAVLGLVATGSVRAEFLGTLNGRSADPGALLPLSVEGTFITGDLFQNIGGRVNYRISDELVFFGDIGLIEFGPSGFNDADGVGFGLGVFYYLSRQRILPQFDVGVKASYHFGEVEFDGSNGEVDLSGISLETLVSGQSPIGELGLGWYVNGGLNFLDLDGFGDETELLLGGGVYGEVGPGEVYAGVDLIDELEFGIGYRYLVR